jgi:protoporphyrinogen oxidase
MAKKRVFILGAGLAGLSAAWHLKRKNIDCRIFEKEPEVGGLCRSKDIDGFTFDYDGHLLHFRHKYTFNFIKNLLGDNLIPHQRSAWIYSFGRYTPYPFQVNLYGLPPAIIKECLSGYIEASGDGYPKKPANFFIWLNHAFGKGIAKHFMIPYNTKFWTISLRKLTCEWVDGFIPVPNLSQVMEGTVKESRRQFGYNARFWYPKKGGIAQVPLALANQVKNIYTNCQIIEIDLRKKEIKMASGNTERFDYLISTIPLPEIGYIIKRLPRHICSLIKKLRWNSIFNLNLGIEKKDTFGRHWIYFPEKEFCFFRVGFPHNFSSCITPHNKNSLYVEVSYSKERPIDKNKIISHIKEDLKKANLINQDDRIYVQDANDIKYGYPIYDRNYNFIRTGILKFLSQNNTLSCGRYGSWRYMSIEDSILDGMDIIKHIQW